MAVERHESERPVWSPDCWAGRHDRCRDTTDSCSCLCHIGTRSPETAA